MSVTIRQVAERAGVSYQTVSRFLNDSGPVSADVKERIRVAIAELGYQPSSLARSLRSKRTGLLGFAVSNILTYAVAAEYRSVLETAAAHGYRVLTGNTDENFVRELHVLEYFAANQVEGVFFMPASYESEKTVRRLFPGLPVVVGRQLPGYDGVDADFRQGIRDATLLHVDNGHCCIGLITIDLQTVSTAHRLEGYRDALQQAGLPFDERYVAGAGIDMASGYAATLALLDAQPRPTAIVVANHFVTATVMLALRDRSLRVPQDMSVVMLSETPWAPLVNPPLTTISYDPIALGRAEIELLIRRIKGDHSDEPVTLLTPMTLRMRSSAAAPQAPPPAYDLAVDEHLEQEAAMYTTGRE